MGTCVNCRNAVAPLPGGTKIECHANAPLPIGPGQEPSWPIVDTTDWCAQWGAIGQNGAPAFLIMWTKGGAVPADPAAALFPSLTAAQAASLALNALNVGVAVIPAGP